MLEHVKLGIDFIFTLLIFILLMVFLSWYFVMDAIFGGWIE